MNSQPIISVVVSTYNDLTFLPQCIDSLRSQSIEEFEIIIIDDASTDSTPDFLASLRDKRVRWFRNRSNLGLTRSLIIGMSHANGEYVARIDADEISAPDRFAKQLNSFQRDASLVLLGGSAKYIDSNNRVVGRANRPLFDEELRWASSLYNPFFGTTVMMRRSVLTTHNINYNPYYAAAQDYDICVRLMHFGKVANLADTLVYSRHRRGITASKKELQRHCHIEIARDALQRWGMTSTCQQVEDLLALLNTRRWKHVDTHGLRSNLVGNYLQAFENYLEWNFGTAPKPVRLRAETIFILQTIHMILRVGMVKTDWQLLCLIQKRWPFAFHRYLSALLSGIWRKGHLFVRGQEDLR